ncbi:MAG: hypothetical protein KJO11_15070, partial [Gemmatimonadetes bacterium]|nr:hypothetical protein [Gemmatimonadota bacterium]
MRRAPLFYRLLLRLYPPGFRQRFGTEMEDTFAAWEVVMGRLGRLVRLRLRAMAVRDALAGAAREWWWGASGRPAGVTETVREGGGVMSGWGMDLRVAVRGLVRRPGLTLAAVATLALGIGATTAVFSVSNGILFRPFGYDDERALVQIWSQNPERGWSDVDVTLPDTWAWRNRADAFTDVAA